MILFILIPLTLIYLCVVCDGGEGVALAGGVLLAIFVLLSIMGAVML